MDNSKSFLCQAPAAPAGGQIYHYFCQETCQLPPSLLLLGTTINAHLARSPHIQHLQAPVFPWHV